MDWILQRETPRQGGTPGTLKFNGRTLFTLEDATILLLLMATTPGDPATLAPWYVIEKQFEIDKYDRRRCLTAIPQGRYRVVLSMSARFGRIMPEILGVPEYDGIRFHGGNTSADTDGCPLAGLSRTDTVTHTPDGGARTEIGIRNCAPAVSAICTAIRNATEPVWVTIIDPDTKPLRRSA